MSDAVVAVAGAADHATTVAATVVAARATLPSQQAVDAIDRESRKIAKGVVLVPNLSPFQLAYFFDTQVARAEQKKVASDSCDAAFDAYLQEQLDMWFRYKCVVKGESTTTHYFQLRNYGSGYVELMGKQNQKYHHATDRLRTEAAEKAKAAFHGLCAHNLQLEQNLKAEKDFLACLATFCGDDKALYAEGVACFAPEVGTVRNLAVWTPSFERLHRHHNVLKMQKETGLAGVTFTPATARLLQTGISQCETGWLLDSVRDIVTFCRNEGGDGPAHTRMCRWQLLESKVQLDEPLQVWGYCPDEEAHAYEVAYAKAQASQTALPANPGVANPRPWRLMDARFDWETPGFEMLMLKWNAYLTGQSRHDSAKWKHKEGFERSVKAAVSGKPLRDYARDAQKKRDGKTPRKTPQEAAAAATSSKKTRISMTTMQSAATAALVNVTSTGGDSALAIPSIASVQQEVADRINRFAALNSLHRQLEELCSKLSAYTAVHTFKVELYRCIILSPAAVVSCERGDGGIMYGAEVTGVALRWRDERDTISFADDKLQKTLTPWIKMGAAHRDVIRGDPVGGVRKIETTCSSHTSTLPPYAAVFEATGGGLLTVNYEMLHAYHCAVFEEASNVLAEFQIGLYGEHCRRSLSLAERWDSVAFAMQRHDEGEEPEEGDAFHMEDPLFAGLGEALCEVPQTVPSLSGAEPALTHIRPFRFVDHVHKGIEVAEIDMLPLAHKSTARARRLLWETRIEQPGEPPKWIIFFGGDFMHRVESTAGIKYARLIYDESSPPACVLDFLEERTYAHTCDAELGLLKTLCEEATPAGMSTVEILD